MANEIDNMYVINAPAGSGKTTYIENKIIELTIKEPNKNILCITYTNRAKDELNNRINDKKVVINTIHSFLSGFISRYFDKTEVIDLYIEVFKDKIEKMMIKGEDDDKNKKYIDKYGQLNFDTIKQNININYNEQSFSSYYYGGLSHDDLLIFSRNIFDKFPLLRKRLSNKYSYIFIDEYQDTSSDVLYIFYQSISGSDSQLYLFGDKMQEIYDNYDGSFNDILSQFKDELKLAINYRCSESIVKVLNNLYNDDAYKQSPYDKRKSTKPLIIIEDMTLNNTVNELNGYMQLYIFNRDRFNKIGAKSLYDELGKMPAYKFPSDYSPTDVLTNKTNDNPDKLFRILFCICRFVELNLKRAYGQGIQLVRKNSHIFNQDLVNISVHNDKQTYAQKINDLLLYYNSDTITINDFCDFLSENKYCINDVFEPFKENDEYKELMLVSFQQVNNVYTYLGAPHISTQHGVKGEGYNNICFISEDSKSNPIVHMYDFYKLLCTEDICLTDFQDFYYKYLTEINGINKGCLENANSYKGHETEYLAYANKICAIFNGNKYFNFCQKSKYEKFIDKPNVTNAQKCFKATNTKGVLWAYKLFYVGCSRAKEKLVVVVDKNKVISYKDQFIDKMTSIGFDVEEK